MAFNFSNLLNRKYKKFFGKVRFVGVRLLPQSLISGNSCIMISSSYGLLSAQELEAGRKVIRKILGKNKRIKLLLRVFPYIPLTGKPAEVRMGRGKGSRIRKWVCFVKPGKIIFEILNVSVRKGMLSLKKAESKLSIKTKILSVIKKKSKIYKI
jgi:large subunit ribosomal protein L16